MILRVRLFEMALALRRVTSTKTFLTMTSEDGGSYEVELKETQAPVFVKPVDTMVQTPAAEALAMPSRSKVSRRGKK